jgi:hypothetical protein
MIINVMANVSSVSVKIIRDGQAGTIFIPEKLRDRPISDFKFSTRQRTVLDPNVRLLGELHGRTYGELRTWRGCGKFTISGLKKLFRQLQLDSGELHLPPKPDDLGRLVVPANARDLRLADLPLSTRAEGVLKKCGYKTLGQLHEVEVRKLQARKNCGPSTIRKLKEIIQRAGAGEFAPLRAKDLPANLREMALAIDLGFDRLSARDKKIYQARVVGDADGPRTLQDIGTEYNMTRERVRQVANEATEKIRLGAGPRLGQSVDFIIREFRKRRELLTSELLEQWLAKRPLRHPPRFYTGVLYELNCFVRE